MKTCSKCRVVKAPEQFGRNKSSPTGLQAYCKECAAIYAKSPKRKESLMAYNRTEARLEQRARIVESGIKAESDRAYNASERGKAKRKAYSQSDVGKAIYKAYQASDRGKEVHKSYRESARGKAAIRQREKTRYANDYEYRLAHMIRRRINSAMKNGSRSGSAIASLGCSISDAVEYITSLFGPGMSWDDRGSFHIDHKIPLALFDLSDPEQFAKANHYTNLQPLAPIENLSKGAKLR